MSIAFTTLIGEANEFLTIIRAAQIIAMTEVTVLILGESGTGKELLARAIHQQSQRAAACFTVINCAALPENLVESELFGHRKGAFTGANTDQLGRIQAAHGGTLFLDEIGELPLATQAKLLRFLETGECQPLGKTTMDRVDTRILAATNRQLATEVAAGRFRADLYYRLNIVPLELPPLRQRRSDIKLLLSHLTQQLAIHYQLPPPRYTPKTIQILENYEWYGNIRELRNFCERMVIFHCGKLIKPEHLPLEWQPPTESLSNCLPQFALPEGGLDLVELEITMIRQALNRTQGNRSQAARLLGLTRDTLLYRMKKYREIL
jgi:transcriptional regulator with PAS, ATPase and Fis domain